ncbi:MAG: methylmalonyl Co-A mutase-associated GTPase MeaB, partial [Gemmatimonadetes bacterium]|nr:methylmalonyl Co-A mutase-associated GTPase MeaB [Gemmatimonadota bacterium]
MTAKRSDEPAAARAILSGDRTALARAITLVESTRGGDRKEAQELL